MVLAGIHKVGMARVVEETLVQVVGTSQVAEDHRAYRDSLDLEVRHGPIHRAVVGRMADIEGVEGAGGMEGRLEEGDPGGLVAENPARDPADSGVEVLESAVEVESHSRL